MARLMGWAAGGAGWHAEPTTRNDVRNTGRRGWVASAWLVAGTLAVAITSYSISVKVAAERRAVEKLAAANRELDADMKGLQAELRVRMRMPQLQRWNDETFGLTPISAHQYLASPEGLTAYGDELPAAPPPKVTLAVRDMAPTVAAPPPRVLLASAPVPPAPRAAAPQPAVVRPAPAAANARPQTVSMQRSQPEKAQPAKAQKPHTVLASAPRAARPAAIERPAEAPKDLLQQVAMLGDAPPPAEN